MSKFAVTKEVVEEVKVHTNADSLELVRLKVRVPNYLAKTGR